MAATSLKGTLAKMSTMDVNDVFDVTADVMRRLLQIQAVGVGEIPFEPVDLGWVSVRVVLEIGPKKFELGVEPTERTARWYFVDRLN